MPARGFKCYARRPAQLADCCARVVDTREGVRKLPASASKERLGVRVGRSKMLSRLLRSATARPCILRGASRRLYSGGEPNRQRRRECEHGAPKLADARQRVEMGATTSTSAQRRPSSSFTLVFSRLSSVSSSVSSGKKRGARSMHTSAPVAAAARHRCSAASLVMPYLLRGASSAAPTVGSRLSGRCDASSIHTSSPAFSLCLTRAVIVRLVVDVCTIGRPSASAFSAPPTLVETNSRACQDEA